MGSPVPTSFMESAGLSMGRVCHTLSDLIELKFGSDDISFESGILPYHGQSYAMNKIYSL